MEATTALVDVLRKHPFVEGMKESHVQKLAGLAVEVQFVRDQTIFRQGEVCALFYLVVSGKVALETSGPGRMLRIQTVGEGDELGWSSLLGDTSKHFQARTLEPAKALAFDGARLRQACEQDPAFGYQFMTKVLKIVARRLQATRVQLLDLYAPPHGAQKLI